MKRVAGARGQFYPSSCSEIEGMIERFNTVLDQHLKDKTILKDVPRAIISPHAGYIYSGFTANFAHRILANAKPKRVVVIGPSHHVFIDGISGSFFDEYESPCGNMAIDKEYLEILKDKFSLKFAPKAHSVEHSTETQMPFIKHYNPHIKVVELIYGRVDFQEVALIIDEVLKDKDNAVVISTDLSHFYTKQKAKVLDSICLEAIQKRDVKLFDRGCEACGIIGVKAMVEVARIRGLKVKLLDYRTSSDTTGDESNVVGYLSAVFE